MFKLSDYQWTRLFVIVICVQLFYIALHIADGFQLGIGFGH